jgi:hypothetical protein
VCVIESAGVAPSPVHRRCCFPPLRSLCCMAPWRAWASSVVSLPASWCQDGRLRDARWLVSEMGSVELVPDVSRCALLASAFEAAGQRTDADAIRAMMTSRSSSSRTSDGAVVQSSASPLQRIWTTNDSVGSLVQAVTAAKVWM